MSTQSRIIPTAPLFGLDLSGQPDVVLPHAQPAPVQPLDAGLLDERGVLATEPDAAARVAAWKAPSDHTLPPLLDPARDDLQAERSRLAGQAVEVVGQLQRVAAVPGGQDRGFQRKTLYVTTTAELRVPVNLPGTLVCGPFQPGAAWRAIVRFSSAAPRLQADTVPDQRAVGVRVTDDAGRVQDLTLTSGGAGNHARDARQFISSMQAAAAVATGRLGGKIRGALGLFAREGIREARRLMRTRRASLDSEVSLASLAFYSRSPFEMGEKLVHLALLPLPGTSAELVHDAKAARDGLGRDLCMRRSQGELRFRLAAAEAPCLDDMSREPAGPWITVGELRFSRQVTGEAAMLRAAARVHAELAMHPFNVWDERTLKPRGELNELLRGPVYRASAGNSARGDDPPATPRYDV